jgi:hypothetical protein
LRIIAFNGENGVVQNGNADDGSPPERVIKKR